MKKFALPAVLIVVIGCAIAWFSYFAPAPPGAPGASRSSSSLSELLGSDPAGGYSMATEARTFRFPQDHGPHPGFRNEWWYLTGNLDSEQGQRF